MKTTRISIILWLCICLFVFNCKEEEKPPAEIEVTISEEILEEIEKSRPQEVFVYEVLPGNADICMKKITEFSDIKGNVKETEDLLFIKEADRYLEVRKISNTAFYGDMANLWMEEPTPDKTRFNVPDNEETRKIAMELLSKFGFTSEDIQSLEISISDKTYEITLPENVEKPISIVVGKNVEVRRRIDELLVYGPGSKIKFYIGENNNLNGYMAVWRQIIPSSAVLGHSPVEGEPKGEKMKPIPAKEAFEILKKNPLEHIPLSLVDKIEIDKIGFGYYSRSATEQQKYLQPVYVFSGTAYSTLPDGKEVNVPYEQYIVALEKPLETMWPDTRIFKPDPRQKGEVPPREEDEDEKGSE